MRLQAQWSCQTAGCTCFLHLPFAEPPLPPGPKTSCQTYAKPTSQPLLYHPHLLAPSTQFLPQRRPSLHYSLAQAALGQALHDLEDGGVLAVGRQDLDAVLGRQRQHKGAARDERLLVGQADVLAGLRGAV